MTAIIAFNDGDMVFIAADGRCSERGVLPTRTDDRVKIVEGSFGLMAGHGWTELTESVQADCATLPTPGHTDQMLAVAQRHVGRLASRPGTDPAWIECSGMFISYRAMRANTITAQLAWIPARDPRLHLIEPGEVMVLLPHALPRLEEKLRQHIRGNMCPRIGNFAYRRGVYHRLTAGLLTVAAHEFIECGPTMMSGCHTTAGSLHIEPLAPNRRPAPPWHTSGSSIQP